MPPMHRRAQSPRLVSRPVQGTDIRTTFVKTLFGTATDSSPRDGLPAASELPGRVGKVPWRGHPGRGKVQKTHSSPGPEAP